MSDYSSKKALSRQGSIEIGKCPECDGGLDTGWECTDCGFDAQPEAIAENAPSTPDTLGDKP